MSKFSTFAAVTALSCRWIWAITWIMAATCPAVSWAQMDSSHLIDVMSVPKPADAAKAVLSSHVVDASGNVLVVAFDGNYDRTDVGGGPNIAARQSVVEAALGFGQAGLDARFDFVVIFTDFPVDLGPDVAGLNWSVSNAVSGIGRPIFDSSSEFGSVRLQSIIDMRNALAEPMAPGSSQEDQVLDTLMHELMHQWGSHLQVDLPGLPPTVLLGRDGTHWSALLSTDASVMYGARWQILPDARARAIGVREQYGPLDLYAAGWLAPDEVPTITLLQSSELDAASLPESGVEISATALDFELAQVVAASGLRTPGHAESQRHFRAALILLQRPGHPIATELLDRIEALRRRAQERFSALTLGRARLDLGYEAPSLAGQSPAPRLMGDVCGGAAQPDCEMGANGAVQWLLATQHSDGHWADKPQTAVRDTLLAVRGLQAARPAGDLAIDRARDWLAQAQPNDIEQQAMLLEQGLISATREQSLVQQLLETRQSGSVEPVFGAQGSRSASTLETARVLSANLAREQRGQQVFEAIAGLRDAVLSRLQVNPAANPPGDAQRCWARELTGPCDALTSAAALQALASAGVDADDLQDSRGILLTADVDPEAIGVAERLHAVQTLGLADDVRALSLDAALRAAQRPDGSWGGSVPATAESLRWLLVRSLPDLHPVGAITADLQAPAVGWPLRLTWTIRNSGPVDADVVQMRVDFRAAEAADSAPWTTLAELLTPPLPAGASADFTAPWDTFGLSPGDYRLRLQIDTAAELAEVNEQNNERQDVFSFSAPPNAVDLVLISAHVSPDVLSTVPQPIVIQAEAVNIGLTAAPLSTARLYAERFGQLLPIAEQSLQLPPQSSQSLQLEASISDPDVSAVVFRLDADQVLVEADEGNNERRLPLLAQPAVDLEVRAEDLSVSPATVEQGEALELQVVVHNRGTRLSPVFKLQLAVRDDLGEERTLLQQDLQIEAGASVVRRYDWTADRSGDVQLMVVLDPADQVAELREDNNRAAVTTTVLPSTRTNLTIAPDSPVLEPDPLLEGMPAVLRMGVSNLSTVDSPASEIAVFLQDPTLPATPVWASAAVPPIPMQSTIEVAVPLPPPAGSGSRQLFLRVDPANALVEANELDNDRLVETEVLALPDLEVRSGFLATIPTNPAPGVQAELEVQVRNLGQQAAGAFSISVSLARDGFPIESLLPQRVSGLEEGGSTQLRFEFTRPVESGDVTLDVWVDSGGEVSEGDEANNTTSLLIGATNPDLYVTEPYISPNGDGIKDSTEIVARVDVPMAMRVRIFSSWGEQVRLYEGGALGNTSVANVVWDGRRDDGRRALDDLYTVQIETGDGDLFGVLSVTVDTNNSPLLDAFPGGRERYVSLGSRCDAENQRWSPSPEDPYHEASESFISLWQVEQGVNALYRSPIDGGEATRVLRLTDLHLGALSSTQRWIVPGREELAVVVISQELSGLIYQLYTLDPMNPELARLVWSSDQHPGFYVGTIDENWAVFRSSAGVHAINVLTSETRSLSSTQVFAVLAQTQSGLLFRSAAGAVHVDVDGTVEVALITDAVSAIPVGSGHQYIIAVDEDFGNFDRWYFQKLFRFDPDSATPLQDITPPASAGATFQLASSTLPGEYFVLQSEPAKLLRFNLDTNINGEVDLPFAFVPREGSNTNPEDGVVFRRGFRNIQYAPSGDRWHFEAFFLRDEGGDGAYEYLSNVNAIVNPKNLEIEILPELGRAHELDWINYPRWVMGETQIMGLSSGVLARRGFVLRPTFGASPNALHASPSPESMLLFGTMGAPQSCQISGLRRVYSSANLSARLDLDYVPAYAGFALVVSAEDQNLAGYRIDARRRGAPGVMSLQQSSEPVWETLVGIWSPPESGIYDLTLEVWDHAGNRTQTTVPAYWFSQSPLGLVQLRDRYISPNGDGRQDVLVVEYATYQAMNLQFEVRNDRDELVFAHADAVTAAGSYTLEWSGMGPGGVLVSDGGYFMMLNNRRLDFVVDTKPPILTPSQPGDDGLPGEIVCDFETTASVAEGYPVWVEPSPPLEVAARESNWESIRFQVRAHDPLSAWVDAMSPVMPSDEEVYAQWRFPSGQWVVADRRVIAEDKAGNVSISASEIAKPFISSIRPETRSIGDNQPLPNSWGRQGLGYQVPVISIPRGARLERVVLEVVDPRNQGGPLVLRYTSDGVTFATLDLLDVASEYQEPSTPGGRCVGPGARVFAAVMPPFSPGSWVRFILSTGVGLDDFEHAVQGEAFDVRIEPSVCQYPRVEKAYCELFSPEEVIVPLLWCPDGIDREFGADSPLNPSIRWLVDRLELPSEEQLVAARAPGCPDSSFEQPGGCPEGYDCSCARLPLTALPDGDVYSLNAVPDELVGQLGLESPTSLPKMFGKVTPDLPTIVLEGPIEGSRVCNGTPVLGEVLAQTEIQINGTVGFLGGATNGITVEPHDAFKRPLAVNVYPGYGRGVVLRRPLRLGPLEGVDDYAVGIYAHPTVRLPSGDYVTLADGDPVTLEVSAMGCFGQGPSVTRNLFADLSTNVGSERLVTPIGVAPPFIRSDFLGPRLGFSPALTQQAALSVDLGEPLEGEVNIVRVADNHKTIRLAVIDGELGQLTLDWQGLDDGGVQVSDGVYAFQVDVADACGHEYESRQIFYVDGTAPVVSFSSPQTGLVADLIVPVALSVVDYRPVEARIEFRRFDPVDGVGPWVPLVLITDPPRGEFSWQWEAGLYRPGLYELRAMAVDEVGNVGDWTYLEVTIPDRPELISYAAVTPKLISPNGDGVLDALAVDVLLSQPVPLSIDVETADLSHVVSLTVEAGSAGVYRSHWAGIDGSGVAVPDGEYDLLVRAGDAGSPIGEHAARLRVEVDATPPLIRVVGDSAMFVTDDDELVVEFDDAHPLRWEAFSTSVIPHLIPTGERFEEQSVLSWTGVAEGEHSVRLQASDSAGNQSTQVVVATVDRTSPQVLITSPEEGALLTRGDVGIEVVGFADDLHFSTWVLEVEDGSGSVQAVSSGTEMVDGPLGQWLAATADGEYTLRLLATDLAGNTAEHQVHVTLDNTPPEVALLTPSHGDWVSEQFAATGQVTDAHLLRYTLAIASRSGSPVWQDLASGETGIESGLIANVLSPETDGPYLLRLQAEDRVGLRAETFLDLEVDSGPPLPPLNLSASRQGSQDVRLLWTASPSADAVAYRLYRDGQVHVELAGLQHLDLAVPDGVHSYLVSAIDRAGNESGPSNQVEVRIDITPPEVRINAPLSGSRNRGELLIRGRAYSLEDFDHYRLSLITSGGGVSILAEAGSPVIGGELTRWDSRLSPDGDYGLLLEAWDLSENRAETSVEFIVDNTPPAAPIGVTALVEDANVLVSWQANSEPDLAGYLVYLGPVLLNGDGNADPRSIVYTVTSHRVEALGDGSHDFRVMAVDTTGNVSDPSAPVTAEVNGHPPRVTLVRPAPGTVFEQPILVRGSTTDQDIVEVQLQYRVQGTGTWTNLGAAFTQPPFERSFLPPDQAYGDYELRAVATDSEGLTDPSPPVVAVEYRDLTAPDAPVNLTTAVDGNQVSLSWSASQAEDVGRYRLERQAQPQGGWQVVGEVAHPALAFVDTGVADGLYHYRVLAIDRDDNVSAGSDAAPARVWIPVLTQPYAPGNQPALLLQARTPVAGEVELERISSLGTELVAVPPMAADVEAQVPVSLLRGLNEFRFRVVDAAGNRSRAASVPSAYDADPVAPSSLQLSVNDHDVSLQWDANPEGGIRGYRLFRRGAAVLSDERIQPSTAWVYATGQTPFERAVLVDGNPDTRSYFFTQDDRDQFLEVALPAESLVVGLNLEGVQEWSASEQVRLEGLWEGRWIQLPAVTTIESDDQVVLRPEQPYVATRLRLAFRSQEAFGGRFQVGEVSVQSRPLLAATIFTEMLPDGAHLYRVSAVNQYGFEGPRSDAVEASVGDAQAPDPVVLSSAQADADVSLSWTQSTAPDLAVYRLYRRGQLLVEISDLAERSYVDAALPNGVYDYQVYAVDAVGNAAGSNVVVHTISGTVPAEPLNLVVSPVDGGGALRLQWSPGLGVPASEYRIARALQAAGPFQPIVQVPAAQNSYVDGGLQNGVRHYYVVAALDARGNASADSNVADGVPFANERLATPVFTYPTRFGQSVTLPGPGTVVAGVAEPDSRLLLGYRDQLWPEFDLPAEAELLGVGYGGQRNATNAAADWIWNDYGYTAVLQTLDPEGGGAEIDLGQACAQAQWLTATILLHCDGQTLPERLVRLDVAALDQPEWVLSQSGIRGFRQSADGHAWLLLASFDWPDGRRDSLALRRDEGPWQELAIDALDIDPDSLQMDPSSRWAMLRRLSDERLLRLDLANAGLSEIDATIAVATPLDFHPVQALAVLAGAGPVGQGLYRLDLASGELQWLDVGGGFVQGAAFSPLGDQLHALIDGQWQLYQWPGMTPVQSADANGAVRMQALATGEVLLSSSESYGELSWLRPAGVFRVDAVPLEPGENLLTALSSRIGQLNSQPALPITILVPADGLPDLEVRASDLSLLPNQVRPGDQPRLGARVRNIGSAASTESDASLVVSTPAGALPLPVRSIPALLPGEQTLISWILPSLGEAGPHVAQLRLDPTSLLTERSKANNQASLSFAVSADGAPDLLLSAQPSLLAPTQPLIGQVSVLSGGQAFAGRLSVRVLSPAGQLVQQLLDERVAVPAVGNGPARDLRWTPGNIAAGAYQVQASLFDSQGQSRVHRMVPISVEVVRTLSLSSRAQPSSVSVGSPIALQSTLQFVAGNAPIEQSSLRVRLETFEGDVLAETEQPLATLLPGFQGTLNTSLIADPAVPAGQYVLRAELWTQSLLAESAASLQITDVTVTAQLSGSLTLPAAPVPIGDAVSIPLRVRNTGGVPLSGIPIRASLRRSLQSMPAALLEQVIDLPVAGEWSGQLDAPSALLGLGDQLVSLVVLEGPHAGVLDFGGFAVVDHTPPQLALVAPSAGSVVPASFRIDARAVDLHHPLAAVRLQPQGLDWLPMSAGIDFAGQHLRHFGPLADGPLSLRLDASDTVGNRTESGPFTLIVDGTPPLVQISGVADGGLYNSFRTPVIEVVETHPQSLQQLLDGHAFNSGDTVTTEGAHVLYVLARDAAGNEGSAIVAFELDFTPPALEFAAPVDGAVIAAEQTLVRIRTEAGAVVTLTHSAGSTQAVADVLGSASFPAVPLSEGVNALQASARDAAGNQSPPVQIEVTRSAATINAVSGDLQVVSVVEPPTAITGQWQLQNLSMLELSPLPVRLTLHRPDGSVLQQLQWEISLPGDDTALDNVSFATAGLTLGPYGLTLAAQLIDAQAQLIWVELAQSTVVLADLTAPTLQWLTPLPDELVGAEPELRVTVIDALSGVDRVELALDGVDLGAQAQDPLAPTHYVAQPGPLDDGQHLGRFRAFDQAGNPTLSERAFVVDGTPPQILITGVSDDQLSNQPLAPVVLVTDPHLANSEILLDGLPFVSGSSVQGEGVHTLEVEAVDALGNHASRTLSFTLDFTPPALSFLSPADGLQTLAAHLPAVLQSEAAARVELITANNTQSASADSLGQVQFAAVPLQMGVNQLQASATDAAGNRSPVVSVEVTRVRPSQAIIEGFLTLQSATVNHGSALLGGYQIGNGGNFDPGPLTVLVRVYAGTTLLQERAWPLQLPPEATADEAFSFDTSNWSVGELRIELSWRAEDEPDASPVIIDQRQLTIRDGDAPIVSIIEPADGAVVGSAPVIRASASDVLTAVARVDVRINAGPWQPMTAASAPDEYVASPFLPIVGYNLVEVRAADTAHNEGLATPIILCRSSSLGEPGDGLFTGPFEGIDKLFADGFEGVECEPPPLLQRVLKWSAPAGLPSTEGER